MTTADLFAELPVPRAVEEAETDAPKVVIHVAGEPQGKGRPRFTRVAGFVRTYTPAETRNYESTLSLAAQDAMKGRPPWECAVAVELVARFSIPAGFSKKKRAAALEGKVLPLKAPDADNILKICDALNGIVFRDDKQVAAARVVKLYALTPGITILVKPIGAAP